MSILSQSDQKSLTSSEQLVSSIYLVCIDFWLWYIHDNPPYQRAEFQMGMSSKRKQIFRNFYKGLKAWLPKLSQLSLRMSWNKKQSTFNQRNLCRLQDRLICNIICIYLMKNCGRNSSQPTKS